MKKTDIAMLVLIAGISIFVAYMIASNIPILKVDPKGEEVKTFTAIRSDIKEPSRDVFNGDSINPTVQVYINGTTPIPKDQVR